MLLSVVAIVVVGVVIALLFARDEVPADGEVALEAWDTAQLLEGIDEQRELSDAERSALLASLQTGEISRNDSARDITFGATIGGSSTTFDPSPTSTPDGAIRSSSDPELIGGNVAAVDPAAAAVVETARTETAARRRRRARLERVDGNGTSAPFRSPTSRARSPGSCSSTRQAEACRAVGA